MKRQDSISTVDDEPKPETKVTKVTKETKVTKWKQIENSLILNQLDQMIDSEELLLPEDVTYRCCLESIKLVGPEKSVKLSEGMIISAEQKLKSQLIRRELIFNQQELNFYNKNDELRHMVKEFCKKKRCTIEVIQSKISSKNLTASALSYEGKEMNIVYAEISQFPCDAIVNSCNNLMSFGKLDMSSGVAKKIFDMAGPNYTEFCESYIKEYKSLEFGKAITYQIPSQSNVVQKYIINVSTPIYQNGVQTNQDFLNIEQNIKAIFVEANKLNIKTLALPIFGGGASGYAFKQIVQNVLNCLINVFYAQDNKSVQKVYITELKKYQLTEICRLLKNIIETPKEQIRQIQFQWQWELNGKMIDYDDEEINRQIDEGYEQFQNLGQTVELKLEFPFTKQPGTHNVDLKTMIMKDKDLGHQIKLSLQTDKGNDKFLFDNQEIFDALNEYLMLQKNRNNHQFQIFYKKHKVVINSDGTIIQLNETTNFKRKVTKVPYQKNQQKTPKNIIIGKNAELKERINEILNTSEEKAFVESFDQKVIDDVQKLMEQELNKYKTDFSFSIPLFQQDDFKNLKDYIIQNSVKQYGEIENGKQSKIQLFSDQQQKIKEQLEIYKTSKLTFPEQWIPQDKNSMKVELPNDKEYKEIEVQFQKTGKGKIFKIYRLQNLILWENYHNELEKLRKQQLENHYTLTQLEQERYLWHGVKGQHPKKIYESMKEAFDITYSNTGMWGAGIYFAEKACYSRGYSYKLTQQDDPIHAGKRVFLCCKVATGRIHTCDPDSTIKRPPAGYDCVSGFTDGSNVFILYGMDARRSYPAYEIIYE